MLYPGEITYYLRRYLSPLPLVHQQPYHTGISYKAQQSYQSSVIQVVRESMLLTEAARGVVVCSRQTKIPSR